MFTFLCRPEAPLPNLYYDANQGDDFIAETLITTVYTFDPKSTLNFVVAKYSLEGKYLGTVDVRGGLLQLCKESVARMDAAYTFGTYYSQSVNLHFHSYRLSSFIQTFNVSNFVYFRFLR